MKRDSRAEIEQAAADAVRDRDAVAAERDALMGYLKQERATVAELEATRDALVVERDDLKGYVERERTAAAEAEAARDALLAERDTLKELLETERVAADEAKAAREALLAERDDLKSHLESQRQAAIEAGAARDALAEERDAQKELLEAERTAAAEADAARDSLRVERDALKAHLERERQAAVEATEARYELLAEREALQELVAAGTAISEERDALKAHLEREHQAAAEATEARDVLLAEREALQELVVAGAAISEERDALKAHLADAERQLEDIRTEVGTFPPGHFYSPLPSLEEVERDEKRIFRPLADGRQLDPPGIDLATDAQRALLDDLLPLIASHSFPQQQSEDSRYFLDNSAFGPFDAVVLGAMLRHLRPKRVIEVGCGYSSAAMLDTDDDHLGGNTDFTFIEPYAELLRKLLGAEDLDRVSLIESRVQDVDLDVFTRLESGDLLFIDSTHVSKIGSDVNHLFFEVLPRLNPGVYVHVHDINFPFEIPKTWARARRWWNEVYVLRALLIDSSGFEITLHNRYVQQKFRAAVSEAMPWHDDHPGGSIYLRRTQG